MLALPRRGTQCHVNVFRLPRQATPSVPALEGVQGGAHRSRNSIWTVLVTDIKDWNSNPRWIRSQTERKRRPNEDRICQLKSRSQHILRPSPQNPTIRTSAWWWQQGATGTYTYIRTQSDIESDSQSPSVHQLSCFHASASFFERACNSHR